MLFLWMEQRAWGKGRMRKELREKFLHYARAYQGTKGLKSFKRTVETAPNLYLYFAGRQAGYVHEWVLRKRGKVAVIGHFAVAKELENI